MVPLIAKIIPIYHGLNETLSTITNIIYRSTLTDYLIKNHKIECLSSALTPADWLSSALIPAEAVDIAKSILEQ